MTEQKRDERSDIVAAAVRRTIESYPGGDEKLTEEVLATLERLRVISYQDPDTLPLLSVAGRTLVLILEHPDMTIREMAIRQGTVESNVQRAVSNLVEARLVTRTKVGRRNRYRINWGEVMRHPDFYRLLLSVRTNWTDDEVTTSSDLEMSTFDAETPG